MNAGAPFHPGRHSPHNLFATAPTTYLAQCAESSMAMTSKLTVPALQHKKKQVCARGEELYSSCHEKTGVCEGVRVGLGGKASMCVRGWLVG